MKPTALLAMLALLSTPALADHDCSRRGISGDWGFTVTGSRVGVGNVAGVGIFTLLKDGSVVNGRQTISLGGTAVPETFSGTYTIGPDCTGSAHINISSPAAPRLASFAVVVTDKQRAIRMVFTDPGTISVIEATRIDSK